MPPVFGPSSLSFSLLWSWATGRLTKFLPSQIAKKLSSKPPKNSSITTLLPASPKLAPLSISVAALFASSALEAIITPFPAQSPSAFTTILRFPPLKIASINSFASALSCVFIKRAVRIFWRAKNSFIKAFEPSNLAAALLGPKIFSPWLLKISTTPSLRAFSGPTTQSSILLSFAQVASSSKPFISTFVAIFAVPALPGATKSSQPSFFSLLAIAYSRPPFPIIKTFIYILLYPNSRPFLCSAYISQTCNEPRTLGTARTSPPSSHRTQAILPILFR